jgi:hypothetical protein
MRCGKKILTGILAIACVLSSGCAFPGRSGSNVLSVDEKGVLTEKIQESDSGGGYTEDELKQYITESIKAYDSSDDAAVKLEAVGGVHQELSLAIDAQVALSLEAAVHGDHGAALGNVQLCVAV